MLSKRTALIGVAVVATMVGAFAVWYFLTSPSSALLRPNDGQTVARGEQVYEDHCASCHGVNLEGEPDWKSPGPDGKMPAPPHDQTGHTWHHADRVLLDITKFGLKKFAGADYQSKMPAYEELLSDADIIAVLSFIKSTWPQDIRSRHDKINIAAAKRAEQ